MDMISNKNKNKNQKKNTYMDPLYAFYPCGSPLASFKQLPIFGFYAAVQFYAGIRSWAFLINHEQ